MIFAFGSPPIPLPPFTHGSLYRFTLHAHCLPTYTTHATHGLSYRVYLRLLRHLRLTVVYLVTFHRTRSFTFDLFGYHAFGYTIYTPFWLPCWDCSPFTGSPCGVHGCGCPRYPRVHDVCSYCTTALSPALTPLPDAYHAYHAL